jgi:hypothetical protein
MPFRSLGTSMKRREFIVLDYRLGDLDLYRKNAAVEAQS